MNPPDSAALQRRAQVLMEMGEWETAFRQLENAASAEPKNAAVAGDLSVAAARARRFNRAREAAELALKRDPGNIEARRGQALVALAEDRVQDAVALLEAMLKRRPDAAQTLCLLALAKLRLGEVEAAEAAIARAEANPPRVTAIDEARAWLALRKGDGAAAVRSAKAALEAKPHLIELYFVLGVAAEMQDDLAGAADAFGKLVSADPRHFKATVNLGDIERFRGHADRASCLTLRSIALDPSEVVAWVNRGAQMQQHRLWAEAAFAYTRSLESTPSIPVVRSNLALCLEALDRPDEALIQHVRSLALSPGASGYWCHLAALSMASNDHRLAEAAARTGSQCREQTPQAHDLLGRALFAQGRSHDSARAHQRAIDIRPDFGEAHSHLLAVYQVRQLANAIDLKVAHDAWEVAHGQPLVSRWRPHDNERNPDRPLRVGYVLADPGRHEGRRHLEAVLPYHDKEQIEAICYCDTGSEPLNAGSADWRDTGELGRDGLADLIRADRIDVLVDLAGHRGDRMEVFALKPAPVAVSWGGYDGTTGLRAIDALIGDAHRVPGGEEGCYAEKLVRLPGSCLPYVPAWENPGPSWIPSNSADSLRLGAVSHPAAITPQVIEVWAHLLQNLPRAELSLLHPLYLDDHIAERYRRLFAKNGVEAGRLHFADRAPEAYAPLHLALDSFPYSAGTALLDAMWLGVPAVSVKGPTVAGRHGAAYLAALRLDELVASTLDDYLAKIGALVQDRMRLGRLGEGLREKIAASPLMDHGKLARELEGAYRTLWREWCAGR